MSEPENYTVLCLLEGKNNPLLVKIANNKMVGELKEEIKRLNLVTFAQVDAYQLNLYQVDVPDDKEMLENVQKKMSEGPEALRTSRKLGAMYTSAPPEETVHIFVQLPALTSSGVARSKSEEEEAREKLGPLPMKLQHTVDQTQQLLERWQQPVPVPDVVTLLGHIQSPLLDEEKVPISQQEFDKLITGYDVSHPNAILQAEKLKALFRVSNDESAFPLLVEFGYTLFFSPPEPGTESSFHSLWDINISLIIRTILSNGSSIRDSNKNTNTGLKRPDYGFLVNTYCLFRGEEKAPNSNDNPERELVEKLLDFSYQPLNFILGYYAIGTQVNYVAIAHTDEQQPPITTYPLFSHDLGVKADRLVNIVHLIRLCSALSWMSRQLAPLTNPEYTKIERPGGVEVTLGPVVKKRFKQDGKAHVNHLESIYALLKEKKVPNTDELIAASLGPGDPHILVKPVGLGHIPKTGAELFQAVSCILLALKAMHAGSNPVYHRDIRRPNILKRRDEKGWFLIDWSDAGTAPTLAVTHMSREEHSPRVFEDNHGGEVDVWGVGRYLRDCLPNCGVPESEKIMEIAERWMNDSAITASAALDTLEESRHLLALPA